MESLYFMGKTYPAETVTSEQRAAYEEMHNARFDRDNIRERHLKNPTDESRELWRKASAIVDAKTAAFRAARGV